MLINVYSIFDNKAGAYMQPFFFQAHGQAVRAFSDLSNDQNSMCGKHPADYTLYHVGVFDDQKAILEGVQLVNLGSGLELINVEKG